MVAGSDMDAHDVRLVVGAGSSSSSSSSSSSPSADSALLVVVGTWLWEACSEEREVCMEREARMARRRASSARTLAALGRLKLRFLDDASAEGAGWA